MAIRPAASACDLKTQCPGPSLDRVGNGTAVLRRNRDAVCPPLHVEMVDCIRANRAGLYFRGGGAMTSPTFVAKFRDGTVTRMTTHCAPDNLDVSRGIILSRAAYESRMKGRRPPPIGEAHFQTLEGDVLCEYDAEAIKEIDGAE